MVVKPILQKAVRIGRKAVPRGWSRVLTTIGRIYPPARSYPARLEDGSTIYLDLRETMCHGFLFDGAQVHERYTEVLLQRTLRLGDVFVDVGANVGYYSRIAARLVGADGHVHAFEPLPAAVALLRKNTASLDNITVWDLAASDQRGTAWFSVQRRGDTSSLGKNVTAREHLTVAVDTLDRALARWPRVDMIKIDVEGFEYEVLRGAANLLKQHSPLLYFELLAETVAARGRRFEDFQTLLAPAGYRLSWVDEGYPVAPLVSFGPTSYVVAIPAGERWCGLVDATP